MDVKALAIEWLDREVKHPENTTLALAQFLESIRAEARAEAIEKLKPFLQHGPGCDWMKGWPYHPERKVCTCGLDAIIADELKERDGRDGGLRWHCKHCDSEFNDSFMEYYCDDDAGEGDYVGACPVCGSRNLITVCSKLKEAER